MLIPIEEQLYTYKAKVLRWVDGDTVEFRVDLGFRLWMECNFRLNGIDTPEKGKPNYKEASRFAASMAPPESDTIIRSYKNPDKYGRWLCDIYVDGKCVNEALVASGLAYVYHGGTKITTLAYYADGKIVEVSEPTDLQNL